MRRRCQKATDHPRSCGEHSRESRRPAPSSGSSPLVRGAPMPKYGPSLFARIIPARAGSTTTFDQSYTQVRDHPRSCGEHENLTELYDPSEGSSPLVRGALVPVRHFHEAHGIIPARAGSTSGLPSALLASGDHPRSCGEHDAFKDALSQMKGIIPARAGSTVRRRR